MYVTYTDLIQIGIFIVALVSLCYQIVNYPLSKANGLPASQTS